MMTAGTRAGRIRHAFAEFAQRAKGRLFRKYAALLVALVGSALVISSAIEAYYSYFENRTALIAVQREKAIGAATIIEQFVREIEGQIGWTTHATFVTGPSGADQRRFDFLRLLRQAPAITEVAYIDPQGREQLRVSRLSMDVAGSGIDRSNEPQFVQAKERRRHMSEVYFRKESEPYMTLSIAGQGRNAGVTVAEVNLKFIWDVVSRLKVGKAGAAYVIDRRGLLIAHPDIGLVLRKTDLSSFPQVAAARATPMATGTSSTYASMAKDPLGREVLTASAPVEALGWHVFVDLPSNEAFETLYASLLRSGLVLLAGLGLAALSGLWLAQRMVVPIRALATGAARIGAGDLDHRLTVDTGDEIETLAAGFNDMAGRLKESYRGLEHKVQERTEELQQSLEYQTATSEVLSVISRSPNELQPVFDTIVATANRLCNADRAILRHKVGDAYPIAASIGFGVAQLEHLHRYASTADRGTLFGRAVIDRRTVHLPNTLADPAFRRIDAPQAIGVRSGVAVPLMRDDSVIGVLTVTRQETTAFEPRQIQLLETFADQAVIAIENARLFEEVQARTRDLTESLHQQTATADVLKVISRSTFDLQKVLDVLVETVAKLCDADGATLARQMGDEYVRAGMYGFDQAFVEAARRMHFMPSRGSVSGRALIEARTIQIPDIREDPEYAWREAIDIGRIRTTVGIPLMREQTPIGVISLARFTVRPFTDKQIELLQTFADQAAIAIENARLFEAEQTRTRELARSVSELEALGEVGRAVSSTLDLDKVLTTVVREASDLGSADGCAIFRYKESDHTFRLWQASGLDPQLEQQVRGLKLKASETAMGRSIASREALQFSDIEAGPDNPLRRLAISAGFKSVLFVPLVRGDRGFGVLVLQRKRPGEFDAATISLLKTFASQSTLAIQNARLFREIEEKGEQLAIASRHKSQFLANMSHELRTPLNAVLGYTELIQDGVYGPMPPQVNAVLERVQSNGRHLLGLINDVLDLSKIEAGQLQLGIEGYSMADVVHTVVAATEPLASAKKLPITLDLPAGLPAARGDERRISQVLLNLLGNAIKFTESGEIRIAAGLEGDHFVVSVADTGPGIPAAEQGRIFEEFHQVDSSNTKTKGGTGLGLAISKRIVEMHGGSISVTSVVGKGSKFTVELPVNAEQRIGIS